MIPLAPMVGAAAGAVGGVASNVVGSAVYDHMTGATQAPAGDDKKPKSLFDLFVNPEAAKTSIIQAGVVTGLVALFFVGLILFVTQSQAGRALATVARG